MPLETVADDCVALMCVCLFHVRFRYTPTPTRPFNHYNTVTTVTGAFFIVVTDVKPLSNVGL